MSTLRRAGFVSPPVVALFHSALILFGATTAWWVSLTPAAKKQDQANAVAQIRPVLRAQQDAWNRGDIDGFMNGYARSKSTIFISEGTLKRGWETVRDRYQKKYFDRAKMGMLTFSDIEIMPLSPDSAVVIGRWKLQRAKDRPWAIYTHLQALAGRLANCARSYIGRGAPDVMIGKRSYKVKWVVPLQHCNFLTF